MNIQCMFLNSSMLNLLEDCRYLYKQDGWRTGGYLHILLDDDNFDDESILFCKEQCVEHPEDPYSELGIKICDEYLKMPMVRRYVFDWLWNGWSGICESQRRCIECEYIKEDQCL